MQLQVWRRIVGSSLVWSRADESYGGPEVLVRILAIHGGAAGSLMRGSSEVGHKGAGVRAVSGSCVRQVFRQTGVGTNGAAGVITLRRQR